MSLELKIILSHILAKVHPLGSFRRRARANARNFSSKKSFSQEGEDIILSRLFEKKSRGFYVDVGAHHPFRFSNTTLLHYRGWRGMNIDPNPDGIAQFKKYRPNDINLLQAVGTAKEKLKFHVFNDCALNTFCEKTAEEILKQGQFSLVEEKYIQVMQLSMILDEHEVDKIDYLNIDVEGLGLTVLESNNWNKHSPSVISIELLSCNDLEQLNQCKEYVFLKEKGYSLEAKTPNTAFFTKL